MAATIKLYGLYGGTDGSPTAVELTDSGVPQRYNTAIPTQRDPGLSKPCNVPPSGQTYRSTPIYTGAKIVGGSFSQLTNWRWFGPGNIKTLWRLGSGGGMVAVALKAGGVDPGCPIGQYHAVDSGDGTDGLTCDAMQDIIPYYSGDHVTPADADSYTTDYPLTFDSSVYTTSDIGGYTKFVVHQLILKDDSGFGEMAELSTGVRWQEI